MFLAPIVLLVTVSGIHGQNECRDVSAGCPLLAGRCSNQVISIACMKTCGICVVTGGTTWSPWSKCSKPCGQGIQTRTRGFNVETRKCEAARCPECENKYAFCSSYSQLCGSNSWVRENCQQMCHTCSDSTSTGSKWGVWGSYSSCTKTCGGGKKTRTRTCSSTSKCPGSATQTINCNRRPCKEICKNSYSEIFCNSFTSLCSNGGFKENCKKSCNACSASSKGVWNSWSNWARCSKSCGVGQSKRSRTCSQSGKCSGPATNVRKCNTQKCKSTPKPKWSAWGSYSSCSKTCGSGTKTKKRTCRHGSKCPGSATKTKKCNQNKCPEDCRNLYSTPLCDSLKSVWCSGESFRKNCKKSCNACSDKTDASGTWNAWSSWGKCSKSCGGGLSKRSRTCSKPGKCSGSATGQRKCNMQKCESSKGVWRSWSTWGKCSKKCGRGKSERNRVCSIPGSCSGQPKQTKNCNTNTCKWGPWNNWGQCTKTCGPGQKVRKRSCPELNHCVGAATQADLCNERDCVNGNSWSTCTKTCGHGTQYKTESNGIRTYQGCNIQNCPTESCIGGVRRKGVPWSCCKNSHEDCGQSVVGGRIIGGDFAKAKEWPFMASLTVRSSGTNLYKHFCGATLISREWALTAGHCVVSSSTGQKYDIGRMRLYAGMLELDKINSYNSNAAKSNIKEAIQHPGLSFPENDIALLKLKTALPSNDFIRPVCLPGGEITPEDTKCFIMGWGVTSPDSEAASNNLLDAEVYNFNIDMCRMAYRTSRYFSSFVKSAKTILCAGVLTEGVDSCKGDSGGPLICQRCQTCNFYVAGIVSFGPTVCGTSNFPAVYTKVLAYENWIQKTTRLASGAGFCSKTIGP